MNIEDYADILDLTLTVTRYPSQSNRYSASFDDVEIKDNKQDATLCSTYGDGKTPSSAISSFCDEIRGKWLVYNSMGEDRREFGVPSTLNYEEN